MASPNAGQVFRINLDRSRLSRNRTVQACQQCRSRKIKCDRSKPVCQSCALHHRGCSYSSGPDAETGRVDPPSTEQPEQTVEIKQQGHLEVSGGSQIRYYSSSSWVAAVEEHARSSQMSFLNQIPQSSGLPTEVKNFVHHPDVDRLISWYAQYCHFWYPVIDILELMTSLEHSRAYNAAPPGALALIAAICYTAACSATAAGDMEAQSCIPFPSWGTLAQQMLYASGYPRGPNLNTICAAFLLAAPSMAENGFAPDPGPVCVLVRAAQSLGLHRDPCSFQLTSSEMELRRVLWWSIHALDMSYAIAHALPPLLHPATYDVQVIVDGGQADRRMVTTIARVNLILSRTLHDIYGIHQPTRQRIQVLDEEVEILCAEEVSKSHQVPATARERFISASQRMCCWKVAFILHQPYLRSLQWPQDSRRKTLHACREYITLFLASAADSTLAPYRWVLEHFNVHHACAIVLQDLIQHPSSAESESLRSLVQTCFSTFSADSHPHWTRLDALRSKAWAANQWISSREATVDDTVVDASLSDWDRLYASFIWNDLLLP
ncbi:hypothetical protein ASPWEDRAFT_24299 [Aspergillus wentii DTO 134E9]|uniref:Zn(2)-C6 fungal-type domain-containing protein n=1 Tax=Aspergillus wentii DTO 134E9 TaxID=1073089 RepID=A0A1L9RU12_ASPWE|nr:uncharacterized protein ASPWEDRAFT_24299 [Aspergillus wentii DTO 134E9]OJJ38358.1 hypothetical protein ASPWEDRAFT_24299 [Aspergillus wentii DTO 134E9]